MAELGTFLGFSTGLAAINTISCFHGGNHGDLRLGLVAQRVPLPFFLQQVFEPLFFQWAHFSVVGEFQFVDLRGQF